MATGFTKFDNNIIDNYICDMTGGECKVLIVILRKTTGYQKNEDRISYSQIQKMSGLSINTIRVAIRELVKRGIINQEGNNRLGFLYRLAIAKIDIAKIDIAKIDIDGYQKLTPSISKIDTVAISKIDTTKEIYKDINNEIYIGGECEGGGNPPLTPLPCKSKNDTLKTITLKDKPQNTNHQKEAVEVLQFLNEKTHKNYRPTPHTLKYIKARLGEGYTVEDCKHVILVMRWEWSWQPDMDKYLDHVTLFRPGNFPKYLQRKLQPHNWKDEKGEWHTSYPEDFDRQERDTIKPEKQEPMEVDDEIY